MVDSCGCAAVVSGLQSLNVQHVFAVAGQPVTHCADLASVRHPGFEWSVNEKVAVEAAVGLSTVGVRSAVLIKQCGLNVGLDPLINAAFQTTGAALLVVVGDDVGAVSSTCEQDSRDLAKVAAIPAFEPRDGADILLTLRSAATLSESAATPVMVRVVKDLHASFGFTDATASPSVGSTASKNIAFTLTKLGRQQFHRLVTWPGVQAAVDAGDRVSVTCRPPCRTGVVAVGAASAYAASSGSDCCWVTSAVSWPLPSQVLSFMARHEDLVVLEEPRPFVEEQLTLVAARRGLPVIIRGRGTGHLPPEGPLTPAAVQAAIVPAKPVSAWSAVAHKPEVVTLDAPPYDPLFRAIARIRHSGTFVAADVGSAVKLCYPPYRGADSALCLGSAISVAAGAARTGRPSVAVIGDFALLHSGFEALIDTVRRGLPVIVVVLVNGVQAQTGGQPSGWPPSAEGSRGPSLPAVIEASGARLVDDLELAASSEIVMHGLLRGWLDEGQPGVALFRHDAGVRSMGELAIVSGARP